jgi:hypothetical protein
MDSPRLPFVRSVLRRGLILALLWSGLGAFLVQARIQFDIFPGYGDVASGVVRAGAWYPVGVEVFNDGPGFDAVIELSAGQFGGASQRVALELPTNTRKRFVIPFFCASSGFLSIDAKLLERGGRLREDRPGNRLPVIQWETPLLGALPGSFTALPVFPPPPNRQLNADWLPTVARLQVDFIPESPIALEGLSALYLNTAEALKLKEPQVQAILTWLHLGGNLIVVVDQVADLSAMPWLAEVLPAVVGQGDSRAAGKELNAWVRSRHVANGSALTVPVSRHRQGAAADDPYADLLVDFELNVAPQLVLNLAPKPGAEVPARVGTLPLLATHRVGRGQATVLAVNPEREPLRSWKLRPWLFARLCDVPHDLLRNQAVSAYGGRSLDGIFGAMIETRQIRKLPIGFLLGLLVVYLVVIGPFDQWWLRKINRPMLTWITFPAYVVLFSLLIYFIGFKLRAGLTEWNELHVVDVLPAGDGSRAVLRGHSYGSVYSPRNETYRVAAATESGTLRNEFQGLWGNADNSRISVQPKAAGFEADVFVPVWSSLLCVTEWVDRSESPLTASFTGPGGKTVRVSNATGNRLGPVWIVVGENVVTVPAIEAHASKDIALDQAGFEPLSGALRRHKEEFQSVFARRQEVFGSSAKSHLDDWPNSAFAASFGGMLSLDNGEQRDFVWSPGFDLTSVAQRPGATVLAWMPDASLLPPLSQFQPALGKRATLLRLSVSR